MSQKFIVERYQDGHRKEWDDFVQKCPMGTLLHSRRFLSYHNERFIDQSLLIKNLEGELIGILPAAQAPSSPEEVSSHPGATYGGLLQTGDLVGEELVHCFAEIKKNYQTQGFRRMYYKPVPSFYNQWHLQDDLYAIFRNGFKVYRRDLLATIDLEMHRKESFQAKKKSKVRNLVKKTEKMGLTVTEDESFLPQYWDILSANLKLRYAVDPVHSLPEMQTLFQLFPDNISLNVAVQDKRVLAGTVIFKTPTCFHTQYLAVAPEGKEFAALDYVINDSIMKASQAGMKYFDFGSNTEKQGQVLNEALYFSKMKHGAFGTVQDFYEVNL